MCCESDGNAGVGPGGGVVAVSACMSGTRGSGALSSTGDLLVRGVGGVCAMCMCLARGGVERGGEWMRELGLGFTNPSSGDRGSVGHVSVFWLRWCGWCRWGVGRGLGQWSGAVGWCYVCVSLDSLCRWQFQVSVYCAWRIPAHLRCTQCSILLHLMDICFLTCICLWQISQIQTFLFRVVGPGLVSTSPAFVSNSTSHPAGPHAQKTVNRAPIAGDGEVRHNLHSSLSTL